MSAEEIPSPILTASAVNACEAATSILFFSRSDMSAALISICFECPHADAFTAEAVNIGEGISSADMYIEHYQKGKLVERFGPVRADYSEEKPDTIQFVYFENEEGEGKNKHTTIHFGIVDKQGNIAADSSADESAAIFPCLSTMPK